ncbi:MFS transporter [Actinopolymorpha sp. B9G3]|uniref:MFS transporter n=1 Tax=Actinopolymorpha sp. B9G3 TaxID=3158970 RepID=UPI0032D95378
MGRRQDSRPSGRVRGQVLARTLGRALGDNALAPLRRVPYRYYLGARFASLLGNAIAPIALAFAVLDLTGSAAALGMVLAARTIPMVVLMLYGGVIADRFRRHVVLVLANALCFATQGLAAGLLLSGTAELWHLAAIEAVNGAAVAFTMPAMQGLMPHLVPREELQQANALGGLVRNATVIGGASAGGAIVGFVGPGWGLAVDALSFGVAAALLTRLRLPATDRLERSTVLHDLRVGWREFVARRWVWVIVVAFGVLNAIQAGALQALGPVIADETFGRVGWGLVNSAQAVGLVIGGLVLLRYRPRHPMRLGMAGMLTLVPVYLVLGLFPSLWLLMLVIFVAGFGMELFGIGWETALQHHIPHEKLSRVASYDMLGSLVALPVGQLLAGPLAEAYGARDVIVVGAMIYAGVVVLTLVDRSVWTLQRADDAAPASSTWTAPANA